MIVIDRVSISDAMFLSSTIAEPDLTIGEAMWLAATSYTIGQEVVRPNHKKYKNILAGVDAGLPEVTPARWTESGVSNKYAVVDSIRNTQSVSTQDVVMVFSIPTAPDSIGITGIYGESVRILINNGTKDIYDKTQSLFNRVATNWYDYFFSDFIQSTSMVKLDLPPVANATITITVTPINGVTKVGTIVLGKKHYIGKLVYGASSDSLSFSTFERNLDGTSKLVVRPTKRKLNAELNLEKNHLNRVIDLRERLDGIPTIWSGLDDDNINDYFELALVNGIHKPFVIDAAYPSIAKINLTIEEF